MENKLCVWRPGISNVREGEGMVPCHRTPSLLSPCHPGVLLHSPSPIIQLPWTLSPWLTSLVLSPPHPGLPFLESLLWGFEAVAAHIPSSTMFSWQMGMCFLWL